MSDALIATPKSNTVNARKEFSAAFGDIPDGTVISDPLGAITGEEGYDARPELEKAYQSEYRALDELMQDGASLRGAMAQVAAAKGLNIADYQLPTYPLNDLTWLADRNTPAWDMLPKLARNSNTVEQDSVTELSQPSIGGERDVPDDSDLTTQPKTQSMTYYRVTGSVSGPMNLASAGFRNAMGVEQRAKSTAMAHFGENLVLNGAPTNGTTDGSINDERAYKGMRTLATDNGRDHEPDAGAGSTITPEMVRENVRRTVEEGGNLGTTVSFADLKTITDLKNALDDHDPVMIEGGPTGTINLGAQSVMIDGHRLVHSDYMPNTAYDASANPDGRQLLTVDMRFHAVHDLASTMMETLAKTEDADRFFLKRYSTMLQDAGAHEYTSLLTGLA
ncbi:SU10 major capsid protein [Halococcus sp. AFM35]|uniref:SU10 major capsid protein n=1 Tax=Halococcus sp. AFM35 TaxID=3421653 RepID=UPI003EBAE422